MDLRRDENGIDWTVDLARRRHARTLRLLALSWGLGALAVLASMFFDRPVLEDPCAEPGLCRTSTAPSPELDRAALRFERAGRCLTTENILVPKPMSSATAKRLQTTVIDPFRFCEAPGPAHARWIRAGFENHVASTVDRPLASAMRAEAATSHALAMDRFWKRLGFPLGLTVLGLLTLFLSRWIRRPLRLHFSSTALSIGRTSIAWRYLRQSTIEDGRWFLRDIDQQAIRSPELQHPGVATLVLAAIKRRSDQTALSIEELDGLQQIIEDHTDGPTRIGSLPVTWTHDGVRVTLAPRSETLLRFARGALMFVMVTTATAGVLRSLRSPVFLDARACDDGDPQCIPHAPEGPLNSLNAYAAHRVCALVDAPVRRAAYDDALADATAVQTAAAVDSNGWQAMLDSIESSSACRESDWVLGQSDPRLRDLWQDGPRNRNTMAVQLPMIERAAEAMIRDEWARMDHDSLAAWETSLAAARLRYGLEMAAVLLLLGLSIGLFWGVRRRLRVSSLEVDGRRVVLDGRSVPITSMQHATVENGRLVVELDSGERIRTQPLENPEDVAVLARWVEERTTTEVSSAPKDLQRLRKRMRSYER